MLYPGGKKVIIDLIDYIERIKENGGKIKQKELSELSRINRYTLSMAINDSDGIYNMKPDAVYRLYVAHPDGLDIPEDFMFFSTASFQISMKMQGVTFKAVHDKFGIPLSTVMKKTKGKDNYFIYDSKNLFSLFKKIYIPVIGDNITYEYPKGIKVEDIKKVLTQKKSKGTLSDKKISRAVFLTNMIMYGLSDADIKELVAYAKELFPDDEEQQIYKKIVSCFKRQYKAKKIDAKQLDFTEEQS